MGRSVPGSRAGRCRWCALLTLSLLATGTGCAINGLGTIAARVERADGALVYTTYAPGLSLRTRAEERGAVLGFTERTCIALLDVQAPLSGFYLGRLPAYPAHCYARHLTAWGTELRTSAPDFSFTVGYRDTALLAWVHEGEDVSYDLYYDTTQPSHTHLEVHPL